MQQVIKKILLAGALIGGLQSAWAFSLSGPTPGFPGLPPNFGDDWQVPVIGYNLGGIDVFNGPKNLGEEYRRNTPVMYYAFNANFLDFFGSNGVAAAEAAFTVMNSLTNVSSYSASLSEFPLNSRHINYQAQALGLYDLKSVTLGLLMEQMGLVDPVRYAWTLHDRFHVGNIPCPVGQQYLVVQRNFDIVSSPLNQLQYSPYVNDTLYSYQILEACTGPNPLALAVPFAVDPLADIYTPVASAQTGLGLGDFYTGLTRDDVAGLRYLLKTNNINLEDTAPRALLITVTTNLALQQLFPTNASLPGGFGTFDLGQLISFSRTNDPATVQAAFPGVIVATSSNYFILATNAVVVSYFTNFFGEPIGTPPHLKTVTNYTFFPQTIYVDTFANIFTNHYRSSTTVTIQTITVGPQNGAPLGSPLKTNLTTKTVIQPNVPSGDYYLLSPLCPVNILRTLQTNVFATTNLITSTGTNVVATNTTFSLFFSQSIVTYFTNYIFVVHPVDCAQTTNGPGLYQGIENVKFVKTSFDSLLGQFFQPITNNYTMVFVINSQAKLQRFQRVVTTPDFLFSAADLATGPGAVPIVPLLTRNLNYDIAHILPGLAGPGTIIPSTTFTLNKVGPVFYNGTATPLDVLDGTPYFNETPGNVADTYYTFYFLWASYDGTTNAPVVYPNGTSIDNLENQIFVQVTPASVPDGINGEPYPPTTFTATGGSFSPPFTWSLAFGSALPAGMTLSSDGTLSGTPTQSGSFDFTLQLTDSLGRSVQFNYTLTIL